MKRVIAIIAVVLSACGVEPITGSVRQNEMCTNCDRDGEIDPADAPEVTGPLLQQNVDLRGCVQSGSTRTCCGSYTPNTDAGVCCRSYMGVFSICWATTNVVWSLNIS